MGITLVRFLPLSVSISMAWCLRLFFIQILIVFSQCILCCQAQAQPLDSPCVVSHSYIELLKEVGFGSREIYADSMIKCNTVHYNSDSVLLRIHYAKNMYFEGIIYRGNKFGIWKGVYKGRTIIEIAYMGEPKNRPIYIGLWNKRGKYISRTFLSIIE